MAINGATVARMTCEVTNISACKARPAEKSVTSSVNKAMRSPTPPARCGKAV